MRTFDPFSKRFHDENSWWENQQLSVTRLLLLASYNISAFDHFLIMLSSFIIVSFVAQKYQIDERTTIFILLLFIIVTLVAIIVICYVL
jgi:hypothetical protein